MEEDIQELFMLNLITEEEAFEKLKELYPNALDEDIDYIIEYWIDLIYNI